MLDEELVNSVMQAEKRMIFRMYIREMHCKEKVMRWKVASKVLRTYYNLYKKAKKNHTLVYLFYQQCFMDILYLITKCFFFTELIFYDLTGKYVVCSTYSWIKLQHFCYEPQKTPLVFWWVSLYSYFDFVNFF